MLTYKVIARKNPTTGEVFYGAQLIPVEPVGITEIAREISDECTITEHDIRGVLSAIEEVLFKALREGRSVRLGQLGSFCPTLISKGEMVAENFTPANITGIHVCFRGSATLRYELSTSNHAVKLRRWKDPKQTSPGGHL